MSREILYSLEAWEDKAKGEVPDCCKAVMETKHGGLCSCGKHEVSITRMSGRIIAARILTVCHHEWDIQDYCADERDGVMLGPVCTRCGAIGEYVMGWEEAMALTVTNQRQKLEEQKLEIMSDNSVLEEAKREALDHLQKADDHFTEVQQLARDSHRKKQS